MCAFETMEPRSCAFALDIVRREKVLLAVPSLAYQPTGASALVTIGSRTHLWNSVPVRLLPGALCSWEPCVCASVASCTL